MTPVSRSYQGAFRNPVPPQCGGPATQKKKLHRSMEIRGAFRVGKRSANSGFSHFYVGWLEEKPAKWPLSSGKMVNMSQFSSEMPKIVGKTGKKRSAACQINSVQIMFHWVTFSIIWSKQPVPLWWFVT